MRITNGIINNNQLYNINNNKVYIDELNNQMSTQKKINNPSDDPIVAIRSLRLRNSLSEITQYYSKNVPDALSWVDTTGTAIDTSKDILRKLKAEYTSASNDTNTVADRQTILTELKALADQFYSVGNSTNEDRYLFTGYRTGDSLTFTKENLQERENLKDASATPPISGKFEYQDITENFTIDDVEQYTYLKGTISNDNITNYTSVDTDTINETGVENVECYRLRMAYDGIGKVSASMGGKVTVNGSDFTIVEITDDTAADTSAADKVYFNKKTGNLIFGNSFREAIAASKDGAVIKYDKSEWSEGDLKPEHYFNCIDAASGSGKKITYADYEQKIQFTVATGQQVNINTNANELFVHAVGRDVEELQLAIEDVNVAQSKVDKLKAMQEDKVTYGAEGSQEQEKIGLLLAAAQKELDYATQKMTKMFSNGVTKATNYFNDANLAGTAIGTTESRLNIIKNRLMENKTTVTTQASDNENVEISDVTVEVSAAQLAYNAALIATGKISQQSLVNYI